MVEADPDTDYIRSEMVDMMFSMNERIETWRDPVDDWGVWSGAFLCAQHNDLETIEIWLKSPDYPIKGNYECIQLAREIKQEFPEFGP